MKKRFIQSLLLLFSLLLMPLGARADREISQLQFGKQVITVASDEVITFYDPWGTENIVDNNSYNAQSLTVFQPAEQGKSVQITFETIDLDQYSNSYYLYMNLYDGIADADDAFTWAASTSAVTASASLQGLSGTLIAEKINNDNKPSLPAVYTSSTADGALSVGFMHRNSNECAGWVAKVKVVTLANMTITGAGSNYDGIGGQLTTKQNVALARAFVTAEGVMNPDPVTTICFTLTQNEGAVDPTALKLFRGDTQAEATVSAISPADNQYCFTLNEAPSSGTTTFTICGDLLGTAAVGAKVQVDITKITTAAKPDGIAPFTAAASVVVENPALVVMTATPQTVTVGETAMQFYDEGGKDGGILSQTNGQVTFLSGVAGKKVMVDFTKNNIWHGSFYNQELRIYNGTEVKADALIRTLQQGETGIVRSTADDGALTVVLFSDAGNEIAADGFEATVSLFTPQPMDFNGLDVAAASIETLAAGDAEQDMLNITVKTLNTEPAMQLTKMAFAAGEHFALVTKASLYFGAVKVGETVPEGSSFEITLTAPQALTEGDNLFTLKYDISDEALNDQTLSAQAVSVTALVNNVEKTVSVADGSSIGTRTVFNLVLSHAGQGTVTKTVNGSVDFNTKTTSSYSSYCEAGTDERVNIFVPKHSGMVAQIDFTEFNVQYASSSYGNKSVFRIYAGQGTGGTLLWELSDNSQESAGPGRVIRSDAADGSLTIVFNPKTSYSYYYKGWKAVVSEYLSKNMQVTAVEATHATTADASIGAAGQELLTVNVKTEGEMNPLALNSIKLNLKGTEAGISKVSVWQGDTRLAEADAQAEVTLAFSEAVTLAEGNNLFTVKADVSGEAEENAAIDAALVSVNAGTADVMAENGDPEGCRILKNMILMTGGDHGTLALALGKQTLIYDDGGAEGDGADGVNATVTLAPQGEADCVKLTNLGITFSYTAHLYIYKGGEAGDDNLIVDLTGSSAKFDPIISDATVDGGKLTLKYVGAGSYTKPNFAIQAEGYKKTDVTVTAVTTEDISTSEVLKGQADVKMLKIAVEAKGELTPAVITAFSITGTDGEAVEAAHIYQTGNAPTFSANSEFSGEYTIAQSGTYYFWLTYDVKAAAGVGQTATATVSAIVVNGSPADVTDPVTATITVASGKSGTYTVGEDADYATIQQAIDDFGMLGMEGPVVLKIKAGEYAEKVRIPYIKGMGTVNTLTIESQSGQRDVKIYHNNYTTSGYSDDQHKKDYGVVTLYQASYVTLKNLEIYTTDKAYKAVVMVKDESRHVTIDNCYLHAPVCTATGEDVSLVGHTIIDEENKNNDYLTVRNCLLEGGKMGISMGGTSYVALPKEVGGVIEGNTLKNNGTKAIYVMDELGVKIKNNTIIVEAGVTTKTSVGILDMQLRDEYSEPTEITGNIFNVAPTAYCAVMNLRQLEGTAEAPVLVANNVINLTSLSASYSALKFNGNKMKHVNVAHNTIRMTGDAGGAAFWAASTLAEGYGNVDVVNNIIQNETSGYAVNLYNDNNLGTDKYNFQNNVIYTRGETFFRAASSTTGGFDAFVEATGATGSVNKEVAFFEGTAEPMDHLDGDLLTALPLNYVATDITGKNRPTEQISIGAYEYDDTDVAPTMADGYPKTSGITSTTAILTVKADVAAKASVLCYPTEEMGVAPTPEELKASGKTMTIQAGTEAMMTLDALEAETGYTAYVVLTHKRGKTSEVYSTEFTTAEVPTEAPVIELAADGLQLQLLVAEGKAPYQLTWKEAGGTILKQETLTELPADRLTLDVAPVVPTDYIVTLKDKQAREAADTVRIVVTGEPLTADFESTYELNQLGFWNGPGLIESIEPYYYYGYFSGNNLKSTFVSGTYAFGNTLNDKYKSWTGFAVSNSASKTFDMADYDIAMYNNCVGGGYGQSQCYAVSYSNSEVRVLGSAGGEQLRGMMITNSAWNVDYYLNGDESQNVTDAQGNAVAIGEGFRESDYCYVTVTGYDQQGQPTASFNYYLADYRTATPAAERGFVNDWQWVDLSTLGTVTRVTFSVHGSRKNAYGAIVPEYFCMDDFNCPQPTTDGIARKTARTADGPQCYDLQGRSVVNMPGKGLYIKDGKKIIIK